MIRLATVQVGADASTWAALGFTILDGRSALANGALVFGSPQPGIGPLAVTGLDGDVSVDGVRFEPGEPMPADPHPNGARSIDHIVIMTDSLDRTSAAIDAGLGLERRRLRETDTVRQAFHRFDDPGDVGSAAGERGCILELVENPRMPHPEVWGLVVIVDDLDALHETYPDLVAPPKPAVQPGRRIATARREADLGTAVAFMTP